jgi:hypothetical protein
MTTTNTTDGAATKGRVLVETSTGTYQYGTVLTRRDLDALPAYGPRASLAPGEVAVRLDGERRVDVWPAHRVVHS